MGKNVFIYGLIDPTSNQLRYIGKSINPKVRLRKHISYSNNHDSYKDRWLRKLIKNNIRPELIIIDEVSENEWQFWEIYYISYFKFIGCYLTNGTNGGDQPPSTIGRKHTDESKRKMSETKKGKPIPWLNDGTNRSEEHKKNLSKSLKGRTSPNKGKIFSKEYKEKLSKSHKGIHIGKNHPMFGKKHSKESINKIKERRKKQVFSEEDIKNRSKAICKKVLQFEDDVLIKEWESIGVVIKHIHVNWKTLNYAIKNNKKLKGYIWKTIKR